ncbi:hypothetical protein BJX99DRAFT_267991 [Aspergillus californicus]
MALFHIVLVGILAVNVLSLGPRRRASIASIPDAEWNRFNATVSGHLHNGEPMLAPCCTLYNGEPHTPDLERCAVVMNNGSNMTFATGQFGLYVSSQWGGCQTTGETCMFGAIGPDTVIPIRENCEQGSVPTKYVDVRTVKHVQRTLKFAGKNRLRVVVKNTGHDYMGRSSAPDSLGLWMHNLRPAIKVNEDFQPEGCGESSGDCITFGAGQQFGGIYDFVKAHGYRIAGGSYSNVGAAGGWITGGGHSLLTNELGLGVDNVQQLKAVLPNGTHLTANRCQNQDLFFALRGGGGGTFAVVTEMTTRVYPKKNIQVMQMDFKSLGDKAQSELMDILVSNGVKWAFEGWGGYISLSTFGAISFIGTELLTYEEAVESMNPLSAFAVKFSIGAVKVETRDNYHEGVQQFLDSQGNGVTPGLAWAPSTRILRQESFADDKQKELSSLLTDFLTVQDPSEPSFQILALCLTVPTIYSQNMPESDLPGGPGESSISPAWRDGIWIVTHFRIYNGTMTDPNLVRMIAQRAHNAMNPLRAFTPGSGGYINEADPWEPDYINSFWGEENYARLLKIQKEVDPDKLLTVHRGIGWDEDDERYGCYPDIDDS